MMNRILFFCWAQFLVLRFADAQQIYASHWTSNPFEHFVFVENKGQFDNTNNSIYYGARTGGLDIYFSAHSLTYRHDEFKKLNEEEKEKLESKGKEAEGLLKPKTHYLQVEWIGANPTTRIATGEPQTFYYTYPDEKDNGKTSLKANCYKKITHKNLYPNIDVEYILPEKGGVKYTLILHPGSDISKVKMLYKNAKRLRKSREGNIIIESSFGDFVDHAPLSFYAMEGASEEGTTIQSAFELNGNTVSFKLNLTKPQPVTKATTIIIDPWVSNPTFTGLNSAFDVNYDLNGNVYVYGSAFPFQLAKFNSSGVLQWSFNNTLFSVLWGYGDFALDEVTGTSYVLEGYTGFVGAARCLKLNSSGFQIGLWPGTLRMSESWRAEYNQCIGKVVVAAGGTPNIAPAQAYLLDPNMVNVTPVNVVGAIPNSGHIDMTLLATDPNGNFCYMSPAKSTQASPLYDNIMLKCPIPNLLPTSFSVPTGHTFGEMGLSIGGVNSTNGFNGMACGPTFLYTFDGSILKKWNKNTGAFIAQVNTGGTVFASQGLSVDECDNVYAGVGSSIKMYNSSLIQITTYVAPNICYDLKLGQNNKLYACGKDFVSEIIVTGSGQTVSATSTPASSCNICNGTATTAITCGSISNYSFQWSPGGQTAQTATGLCPGNYTVTLTTNCSNTNSKTATVTVASGGTLTLTISKIDASCSTTGSATVTAISGNAPYTYLWSNSQTGVTATNLSKGTYTVTVTDANGCISVQAIYITQSTNITLGISSLGSCSFNNGTATVNPANGNSPYTYQWSNGQTTITATGLNSGTSYTITVIDASGCSSTGVKTIQVPIPLNITTSSSNITCGTSGTAWVTAASGGVSPYTYNWSNGITTSSISVSTAGTYTVTVTDAVGCTVTKTFGITGAQTVFATFTQSPNGTICVGTTVNFTNTGSTGSGVTHLWNLSPVASGTTTNFSYTFLFVGTYNMIHTVTNAGCSATASSSITVIDCNSPTVTTTGSSICPGACATITSSGTGGISPYTYSWSNGVTTQNINSCPASTTTYTVTITDTGGKTSTSTATAIVNPAVNVTATPTNISCNGGTNGSATAVVSTGSSPYTYSWSIGGTTSQISNLASQIYTVTVTDSKGCTSTATTSIIAPPPLTGQFTKGTANCGGCGCKEWIMVNAIGGISPYSYSWPDGYANRYKNQLCPGTYIINIIDKNGCSVNVNLTVP
ncbi:MAG: PKD domain-containing protein [Bacteroidetes bacterium]|nr:PKD domain-containing protein [Bacteroidota bacterium]